MGEFTQDEILKLLAKIIGPIHPTGSTHVDDEHKENIDVYTNVAYEMIRELSDVAKNRKRQEASMRQIGNVAHRLLVDLTSFIDSGTPVSNQDKNPMTPRILYFCPVCEAELGNGVYKSNYCGACGLKFDWEGIE